MKAAAFDYIRAASVDEVVQALAAHEDAKILAGGQSLVPLLNMRLARPAVLVDINRIGELAYLRRSNGDLAIGALTRHRAAEISELVRRDAPLLAEALRHVGHLTIRNRGTIGGSAAHADPAAELPATLVALDAQLVLRGPRAERVVAARDFFQGYLQTTLEADEIVTEIRIPVLPAGSRCAVAELARRSGDFALVAVFAVLVLAPDGTCRDARIAVAGAGSVPVRATEAEAILVGRVPDAGALGEAAAAVAAATDPPSDIHAPATYRREMVVVLTRRAVRSALQDDHGNGGAR
jgi:aerobic carbon-monoxide dehydrogenase medium subunit